jgi:hypothetical protein
MSPAHRGEWIGIAGVAISARFAAKRRSEVENRRPGIVPLFGARGREKRKWFLVQPPQWAAIVAREAARGTTSQRAAPGMEACGPDTHQVRADAAHDAGTDANAILPYRRSDE